MGVLCSLNAITSVMDTEVIKEQRVDGTMITTTKRNPWVSSICCVSMTLIVLAWLMPSKKIPDHINIKI